MSLQLPKLGRARSSSMNQPNQYREYAQTARTNNNNNNNNNSAVPVKRDHNSSSILSLDSVVVQHENSSMTNTNTTTGTPSYSATARRRSSTQSQSQRDLLLKDSTKPPRPDQQQRTSSSPSSQNNKEQTQPQSEGKRQSLVGSVIERLPIDEDSGVTSSPSKSADAKNNSKPSTAASATTESDAVPRRRSVGFQDQQQSDNKKKNNSNNNNNNKSSKQKQDDKNTNSDEKEEKAIRPSVAMADQDGNMICPLCQFTESSVVAFKQHSIECRLSKGIDPLMPLVVLRHVQNTMMDVASPHRSRHLRNIASIQSVTIFPGRTAPQPPAPSSGKLKKYNNNNKDHHQTEGGHPSNHNTNVVTTRDEETDDEILMKIKTKKHKRDSSSNRKKKILLKKPQYQEDSSDAANESESGTDDDNNDNDDDGSSPISLSTLEKHEEDNNNNNNTRPSTVGNHSNSNTNNTAATNNNNNTGRPIFERELVAPTRKRVCLDLKNTELLRPIAEKLVDVFAAPVSLDNFTTGNPPIEEVNLENAKCRTIEVEEIFALAIKRSKSVHKLHLDGCTFAKRLKTKEIDDLLAKNAERMQTYHDEADFVYRVSEIRSVERETSHNLIALIEDEYEKRGIIVKEENSAFRDGKRKLEFAVADTEESEQNAAVREGQRKERWSLESAEMKGRRKISFSGLYVAFSDVFIRAESIMRSAISHQLFVEDMKELRSHERIAIFIAKKRQKDRLAREHRARVSCAHSELKDRKEIISEYDTGVELVRTLRERNYRYAHWKEKQAGVRALMIRLETAAREVIEREGQTTIAALESKFISDIRTIHIRDQTQRERLEDMEQRCRLYYSSRFEKLLSLRLKECELKISAMLFADRALGIEMQRLMCLEILPTVTTDTEYAVNAPPPTVMISNEGVCQPPPVPVNPNFSLDLEMPYDWISKTAEVERRCNKLSVEEQKVQTDILYFLQREYAHMLTLEFELFSIPFSREIDPEGHASSVVQETVASFKRNAEQDSALDEMCELVLRRRCVWVDTMTPTQILKSRMSIRGLRAELKVDPLPSEVTAMNDCNNNDSSNNDLYTIAGEEDGINGGMAESGLIALNPTVDDDENNDQNNSSQKKKKTPELFKILIPPELLPHNPIVIADDKKIDLDSLFEREQSEAERKERVLQEQMNNSMTAFSSLMNEQSSSGFFETGEGSMTTSRGEVLFMNVGRNRAKKQQQNKEFTNNNSLTQMPQDEGTSAEGTRSVTPQSATSKQLQPKGMNDSVTFVDLEAMDAATPASMNNTVSATNNNNNNKKPASPPSSARRIPLPVTFHTSLVLSFGADPENMDLEDQIKIDPTTLPQISPNVIKAMMRSLKYALTDHKEEATTEEIRFNQYSREYYGKNQLLKAAVDLPLVRKIDTSLSFAFENLITYQGPPGSNPYNANPNARGGLTRRMSSAILSSANNNNNNNRPASSDDQQQQQQQQDLSTSPSMIGGGGAGKQQRKQSMMSGGGTGGGLHMSESFVQEQEWDRERLLRTSIAEKEQHFKHKYEPVVPQQKKPKLYSVQGLSTQYVCVAPPIINFTENYSDFGKQERKYIEKQREVLRLLPPHVLQSLNPVFQMTPAASDDPNRGTWPWVPRALPGFNNCLLEVSVRYSTSSNPDNKKFISQGDRLCLREDLEVRAIAKERETFCVGSVMRSQKEVGKLTRGFLQPNSKATAICGPPLPELRGRSEILFNPPPPPSSTSSVPAAAAAATNIPSSSSAHSLLLGGDHDESNGTLPRNDSFVSNNSSHHHHQQNRHNKSSTESSPSSQVLRGRKSSTGSMVSRPSTSADGQHHHQQHQKTTQIIITPDLVRDILNAIAFAVLPEPDVEIEEGTRVITMDLIQYGDTVSSPDGGAPGTVVVVNSSSNNNNSNSNLQPSTSSTSTSMSSKTAKFQLQESMVGGESMFGDFSGNNNSNNNNQNSSSSNAKDQAILDFFGMLHPSENEKRCKISSARLLQCRIPVECYREPLEVRLAHPIMLVHQPVVGDVSEKLQHAYPPLYIPFFQDLLLKSVDSEFIDSGKMSVRISTAVNNSSASGAAEGDGIAFVPDSRLFNAIDAAVSSSPLMNHHDDDTNTSKTTTATASKVVASSATTKSNNNDDDGETNVNIADILEEDYNDDDDGDDSLARSASTKFAGQVSTVQSVFKLLPPNSVESVPIFHRPSLELIEDNQYMFGTAASFRKQKEGNNNNNKNNNSDGTDNNNNNAATINPGAVTTNAAIGDTKGIVAHLTRGKIINDIGDEASGDPDDYRTINFSLSENCPVSALQDILRHLVIFTQGSGWNPKFFSWQKRRIVIELSVGRNEREIHIVKEVEIRPTGALLQVGIDSGPLTGAAAFARNGDEKEIEAAQAFISKSQLYNTIITNHNNPNSNNQNNTNNTTHASRTQAMQQEKEAVASIKNCQISIKENGPPVPLAGLSLSNDKNLGAVSEFNGGFICASVSDGWEINDFVSLCTVQGQQIELNYQYEQYKEEKKKNFNNENNNEEDEGEPPRVPDNLLSPFSVQDLDDESKLLLYLENHNTGTDATGNLMMSSMTSAPNHSAVVSSNNPHHVLMQSSSIGNAGASVSGVFLNPEIKKGTTSSLLADAIKNQQNASMTSASTTPTTSNVFGGGGSQNQHQPHPPASSASKRTSRRGSFRGGATSTQQPMSRRKSFSGAFGRSLGRLSRTNSMVVRAQGFEHVQHHKNVLTRRLKSAAMATVAITAQPDFVVAYENAQNAKGNTSVRRESTSSYNDERARSTRIDSKYEAFSQADFGDVLKEEDDQQEGSPSSGSSPVRKKRSGINFVDEIKKIDDVSDEDDQEEDLDAIKKLHEQDKPVSVENVFGSGSNGKEDDDNDNNNDSSSPNSISSRFRTKKLFYNGELIAHVTQCVRGIYIQFLMHDPYSTSPENTVPSITKKIVDQLLSNLQFQHQSKDPQHVDKQITVCLSESVAATASRAIIGVHVDAVDDVTQVLMKTSKQKYIQNPESHPLFPYGEATLADPDTDCFNGGFMKISIVSGASKGDELSFKLLTSRVVPPGAAPHLRTPWCELKWKADSKQVVDKKGLTVAFVTFNQNEKIDAVTDITFKFPRNTMKSISLNATDLDASTNDAMSSFRAVRHVSNVNLATVAFLMNCVSFQNINTTERPQDSRKRVVLVRIKDPKNPIEGRAKVHVEVAPPILAWGSSVYTKNTLWNFNVSLPSNVPENYLEGVPIGKNLISFWEHMTYDGPMSIKLTAQTDKGRRVQLTFLILEKLLLSPLKLGQNGTVILGKDQQIICKVSKEGNDWSALTLLWGPGTGVKDKAMTRQYLTAILRAVGVKATNERGTQVSIANGAQVHIQAKAMEGNDEVKSQMKLSAEILAQL